MNRFSTLLAAIIAMMVSATALNAQFTKGNEYLGATVGLSSIGSSVSIGADYEYAATGKVGIGKFGVGAIANFWSYEYPYYRGAGWSYDYIAIGATGSYHFELDNRKWDPFVGLVLGYYIVSFDGPGAEHWNDYYYGYSYDHSRMFLGLQAGARYFVSDNLAVQARLGFGAHLLAVGLDFKF